MIMAISKPLIGELRIILRDVYGTDVSEQEATEIGTNFIRYFDLLAKIDHQSQPNAP